MNAATWQVDHGDDEDVLLPGEPVPAVVSLHFIRSALRRRLLAWLCTAAAGVLLGAMFLIAVPSGHTAQTTLNLAHDPDADPADAMLTDVSLATTRALAKQVITQLGLDETEIGFIGSIEIEQTTTSVLTITMGAGTEEQAVTRLRTYVDAYLAYRAKQLTAQADALATGTQARIADLNKQADALTKRIEAVTNQGLPTSTGVAELISERAQYTSQESFLQQSVDDAKITTTSIVAASTVIDAPAIVPSGRLKRMALVLLTGLIGGLALGVGLVLFGAVISDKLFRRVEVATALEVPVTTSVGPVAPLISWAAQLPGLKRRSAARDSDLRRLARAIEVAVPASDDGQWLAVGCVDNAREVGLGVVLAAAELQRSGRVVRVVDLTDAGVVEGAIRTVLGATPDIKLAVSRPRMAPSLARDASDIDTYGPATREIPALRETQVFLAIADLDPSVGAFHLTSWTRRVVMAVTAGQSSAERVRTAADMVRTAGLELYSGLLVRTERTDASSPNPLVADSA